jgi:phosphoribosyl 1,2-cyclic phosphodiesterase
VLRFKNLGSGSAGNATLVEAQCGAQVSRLLIDCGLSLRELGKRLQAADLNLEDIDAVFITHEHADHVGHARSFAQKTGAAVWMSKGTALACNLADWDLAPEQFQMARDGESIDLGALQLHPFTVPHDAREPLQLRCTDGDVHLGVLTDLGHGSSHVVQALQHCHALLLECNHDGEMLEGSSYPAFLKQRIGGRYGHLCNEDAAMIAKALDHPGLEHIVAAHLSKQNNRPDLAREALGNALGRTPQSIGVASQVAGFDWVTI